MSAFVPPVRVIVRLPYNRPTSPDAALVDPAPIEWTSEKADILWKVIERSRKSDSAGADWKGLAAHLEVPLPYLLYRVEARFQEEMRGLKDIQGALSPGLTPAPKPFEEGAPPERPRFPTLASGGPRLNTSIRLSTPLGVRARLTSLGNNSPRKAVSSSTLTLQPAQKSRVSRRQASVSSSDETDSDEEEVLKEEEAEKEAEEQDALDRKLRDLQKMMTSEALGLVSTPRPPKNNAKGVDRGRVDLVSPTSLNGSYRSYQNDTLSSRSHSISSVDSPPHGSMPDIPSPNHEPPSQSQSPSNRHLKSTSPTALSPRGPLGQRFGPLVDRAQSGGSSNYSSGTSSYSDISDASLSASALESALLSNIRGAGSRFSSQFARSRIGRGGASQAS